MQKPFSAKQARAAIENALTEERLRREKESLTQALTLTNQRLQRQVHNWIALNDIAQAITSTLEESEVFRRVMTNVNRILQVEAGSLLLLNQETEETGSSSRKNVEAGCYYSGSSHQQPPGDLFV